MYRYAFKLLLRDRLRFGITALGVAMAVVLVLALNGLFTGRARQVSLYIEKAGADIFVAQAGVRNMHMATSVLPDDLAGCLEEIPGVARAIPTAYYASKMEIQGQQHLVYVIGLPPGTTFGGPWNLAEGAAAPGRGEVVISAEDARSHGTGLGDTASVQGRPLRVAGLGRDMASLASSLVFVSLADAQEMRRSGPLAAYYLLRTAPDADPRRVVSAIEEQVTGVTAMTRADLAESDRAIALQMGISILGAMAVAGFVIGLAVVGLSVYAAAVEQLRQYGVLKAVGAGRLQLLSTFLLQAQMIALAGFGLGLALTALLRMSVPYLVPGFALDLTLPDVARTLMQVLTVGAAAALPPWWRVSRVDPMMVFRT